MFVCSIYPPDSWENVRRLSTGQMLPRPTFRDTGCTMSACYFVLPPVYICRCETDPCAVLPHHTKNLLGN